MVSLLWQRETEGQRLRQPRTQGHARQDAARSPRRGSPTPRSAAITARRSSACGWELFGTTPAQRPFVPGTFRRKAAAAAARRPPRATRALARWPGEAPGRGSTARGGDPRDAHPASRPDPPLRERAGTAGPDCADHDALPAPMLLPRRPTTPRRMPPTDRRGRPEPLKRSVAHRHVADRARRCATATDAELAALCLAEELAKLDARRGARREIEDADGGLSTALPTKA